MGEPTARAQRHFQESPTARQLERRRHAARQEAAFLRFPLALNSVVAPPSKNRPPKEAGGS